MWWHLPILPSWFCRGFATSWQQHATGEECGWVELHAGLVFVFFGEPGGGGGADPAAEEVEWVLVCFGGGGLGEGCWGGEGGGAV